MKNQNQNNTIKSRKKMLSNPDLDKKTAKDMNFKSNSISDLMQVYQMQEPTGSNMGKYKSKTQLAANPIPTSLSKHPSVKKTGRKKGGGKHSMKRGVARPDGPAGDGRTNLH